MNMHWCTCRVNVAGQGFQVHEFNEHGPVSWPEVHVLSALHGEENIYEIRPVRVSETTARAEKDRLIAKYGYNAVEKTFPGRVFRMEMQMPGETVDQLRVDSEGDRLAITDISEDDEARDELSQAPPPGAVFKPGKQRPPA
jgi:hypothetical protein